MEIPCTIQRQSWRTQDGNLLDLIMFYQLRSNACGEIWWWALRPAQPHNHFPRSLRSPAGTPAGCKEAPKNNFGEALFAIRYSTHGATQNVNKLTTMMSTSQHMSDRNFRKRCQVQFPKLPNPCAIHGSSMARQSGHG